MQGRSHCPQVRPAADVFESDSGIKAEVNMPGVRAEDLTISAQGAMIRIRASSRCPLPAGQDRDLRNLEFGNVDYVLDLALDGPLTVPLEMALDNGVLTLCFPRSHGRLPAVSLR